MPLIHAASLIHAAPLICAALVPGLPHNLRQMHLVNSVPLVVLVSQAVIWSHIDTFKFSQCFSGFGMFAQNTQQQPLQKPQPTGKPNVWESSQQHIDIWRQLQCIYIIHLYNLSCPAHALIHARLYADPCCHSIGC